VFLIFIKGEIKSLHSIVDGTFVIVLTLTVQTLTLKRPSQQLLALSDCVGAVTCIVLRILFADRKVVSQLFLRHDAFNHILTVVNFLGARFDIA